MRFVFKKIWNGIRVSLYDDDKQLSFMDKYYDTEHHKEISLTLEEVDLLVKTAERNEKNL